MKKRHSAEQIIRIIGEIENSGLKVSDACRPHGISEQTYFRWKKKFGGMDVSEATRLKALEEENSRLKRLVADQALDIQILKEVKRKKMVSPAHRKMVVETMVAAGRCKVARACRLFGLPRSSVYQRGVAPPEKRALEGLVAENSRAYPAFGYRKVTAILRDEHEASINPKRVARLRRRDGLLASRRGTKRRRVKPRQAVRRSATRRDEVWSYDFIQDSLADGRPVRILSVIDEYSRECVMLRSARSFPARRVIDCLEELLVTTGRKPEWLRSDNGPEFVAAKVQEWLATAEVGSAYITPGSPWENGHVESFHASLRPELLDRELFFTMKEVAVRLEDWRHLYNHKRPHGSLGNKPPVPLKNKIVISPLTTKNHLQNSQ